MAVALVDGTICTQKIQVLPAVDVPSVNALGSGQHDRQRRIVVCTVSVLPVYVL